MATGGEGSGAEVEGKIIAWVGAVCDGSMTGRAGRERAGAVRACIDGKPVGGAC